MRKALYAIRDNMAQEVLGGVHVFAHDAVAVRFFMDIAADVGNMIHRHPQDHELVRVGYIETETGVIEGHEVPVSVVTGATLVAMQEANKNG